MLSIKFLICDIHMTVTFQKQNQKRKNLFSRGKEKEGKGEKNIGTENDIPYGGAQ